MTLAFWRSGGSDTTPICGCLWLGILGPPILRNEMEGSDCQQGEAFPLCLNIYFIFFFLVLTSML